MVADRLCQSVNDPDCALCWSVGGAGSVPVGAGVYGDAQAMGLGSDSGMGKSTPYTCAVFQYPYFLEYTQS